MKITIACVGKIKEKYLTAGIEEFSKRLTPFCKLETLAINEERMPDNPSPAEKQQVLERETQRLLAIIPANSYVILLDVIGKQLSSRIWRQSWMSWRLRQQPHHLRDWRCLWLY